MMTDSHEPSLAYLLCSRVWRPHLTTTELAIVSYLIDNSHERGLDHFEATYDTMESGVPATSGPWPWEVAPIGVTRAPYYRALARLRAMGLVNVTAAYRKVSRFSLNLDWQPSVAVKN